MVCCQRKHNFSPDYSNTGRSSLLCASFIFKMVKPVTCILSLCTVNYVFPTFFGFNPSGQFHAQKVLCWHRSVWCNTQLLLLSSFSFFFFFQLLSDHNHRVDYFGTMVCAEYVYVAIIHQTLTWTTWSLTCALKLMRAIAHRGVWTPKESLHWKLTLGKKKTCCTVESNLHPQCDSPVL